MLTVGRVILFVLGEQAFRIGAWHLSAASVSSGSPVSTSAACYSQSLSPQEIAQVDTIVAHSLASEGVPSASVAIVRNNQIVFAKAYGKQSETMAVPRTDAPYQIASISKQFTAAAILLLQDEGKLSLDDRVSKYVPGITDGDKISLRQLLEVTPRVCRITGRRIYSFKAMANSDHPRRHR